MIKQVYIVQCDICGKIDLAKISSGQYNETNYILPDEWNYGHTKEIHLCPDCYNKITRGNNNE